MFDKIAKFPHWFDSQRSLSNIFFIVIFAVTMFIYSCCFSVAPAFAHRPHDIVSQVILSPNYQNNQTLFILVRYNLFKSVDGGKSWQRISNGIDTIGHLVDLGGNEQNDQVMYFTTDFDGVYKSEDGGDSWFQVNNGLNTLVFSKVSVAPGVENFALVAGKPKEGKQYNAIYKTENGGDNWQEILTTEGDVTSILITENRDEILVGDRRGNVYLSRNQGQDWQTIDSLKNQKVGAISSLADASNSQEERFWLGTDKKGIYQTVDGGNSFMPMNEGISDPRITDILVGEGDNLYVSTWDDGFFASTDGGKTWIKQIQGLQKDEQADQLKYPHFEVLAKSGEQIFMGAFDGLFKSDNLGQSWTLLETLAEGTVVSYAISPNYAQDQTVAIVTYVGNFYLTEDGGKTWTPKNRGLEILRLDRDYVPYKTQHPRRFFDVAFSPNYANDKTIFSSLLWTKMATSYNKGDSWNPVSMSREVRGLQVVPSPDYANDKTVYVANQQGLIYKSSNGGKSFSLAGKHKSVFGNDSPSLVISPNFSNDRTLYSYTEDGVYKSSDAGKNWKSINLREKYNLQLAISPNYSNDNTLFASTHLGLFKTEDQGDTWTNLPVTDLGKEVVLEGVAISPNYVNDQTILVSTRGKGLYKSTDGGQSFREIGDRNIPYARTLQVPSSGLAIRFSPDYAQDNTIYSLGSATTAMYKSTDGGETWETLPVAINPVPMVEEYDLPTSISLWFSFYRGKVLRFLVAALVGLFAYFFSGLVNLEKKLPFSKLVIKISFSIIMFFLAFLILNQV